MGKVWMLFDGRAESGDTEDAAVIEVIGTSKREVRKALYNYQDFDAVLVEYDTTPDTKPNSDILSNERIIGHLREGWKALLQRCSPAKTRLNHE